MKGQFQLTRCVCSPVSFPFRFNSSETRSGALLRWWRIDEASGQLESNE